MIMLNMHRHFALLIVFSFALTLSACEQPNTPRLDAPKQASAEDHEAKLKDLRTLLNITGSTELGQKVLESVISNYKRNYPKIPETFWVELHQSSEADKLIEEIIPIYDAHYTHADIKGLIAHYNSPLGQKVLKTLPKITTESMQISQKWGMGVNDSIAQKLKAKGYLEPAFAQPVHDHGSE